MNLGFYTGRLTRDPEPLRTVGDTCVCKFGLAIDDERKRDDPKKKPIFVDVEAWGKQAELISEHFSKGDPIIFSARLKMDEWEDKNSGQRRTKIYLSVDRMEFPPKAKDKAEAVAGRVGPVDEDDPPDDTIPF